MVERYTLKNGIPLFVVENSAAPVVSVQTWVRRGSAHETEELAGISHFIEHALFKGTRKRQVGEIALEIEACGGEVNAFTSFEETVYYATLASRYFEQGLDVIADAVQNPLFEPEEMEREREVILEEIKRAHDSPHKIAFTNLWKQGFKGTPYGRPVLGFDKTVRKFRSSTLKSYYQRNYHTGTFGIFVVGDVAKEEVYAKAQRLFSKAKPGPKRTQTLRNQNFKLGRLGSVPIVTAARDIQECQVLIGFRCPSIKDPAIPPLDLLCSAVGQGESGRFYQRLVKEKHAALDAEMGIVATNQCGMATIGLSTAPDKLMDAVSECQNLISELIEHGVRREEVERVKSALESESVFGKETVEGYARRLGYYHCHFGDPEYEKHYLEALLGTSSDHVDESLTSLFATKPTVSIVHPRNVEIDKKAMTAILSPVKAKKTGKSKESPLPKKQLDREIRFISKTNRAIPSVSLRLIFQGGSREEEATTYGIGNLFQRIWTAGTPSFASLEIAKTLESLGAHVNGFCGRNTLGLSVEFLSKHWSKLRPIVREILTEPTFPESEIAVEKPIILQEIAAESDSPALCCQLNYMRAIYGSHPYGRSQLGTKQTVEKFTSSDLKKFYKQFIYRKNLVIGTVGDFQRKNWIDELAELCKSLPETGKTPQPRFEVAPLNELKIVTATKQPLFQSHILVGFQGTCFSDPERFALKLISSALSGQGGRLFLELRDRLSLAYTVTPLNTDSPETGSFAIYIGCSPEKLERSIVAIRGEVEKLLSKAPTREELSRAKNYWLGRFELDMQRNSTQAMLLGLDEAYGLGFDHYLEIPKIIKSLTAKDLREAARKYFTPEKAVISIVHPTEIDEANIRKIWLNA